MRHQPEPVGRLTAAIRVTEKAIHDSTTLDQWLQHQRNCLKSGRGTSRQRDQQSRRYLRRPFYVLYIYVSFLCGFPPLRVTVIFAWFEDQWVARCHDPRKTFLVENLFVNYTLKNFFYRIECRSKINSMFCSILAAR